MELLFRSERIERCEVSSKEKQLNDLRKWAEIQTNKKIWRNSKGLPTEIYLNGHVTLI
jgi:hypothetical protein